MTNEFENLFQAQGFMQDGQSRSWRENLDGVLSGVPGEADSPGIRLLNIKARSRHIISSNAYAKSAANNYVSNTIGNGYTIEWEDETLQELWEEFESSPMASNQGNLHSFLLGASHDLFASGENLFRFLTVPDKPLQLGLQWIPDTRLSPINTEKTQKKIQGIQFGRYNRIVKYHLARREISDLFDFKSFSQLSVGIKASEINHAFLKTSADQIRGVPAVSSALLALYEVDELMDATLVRQKASQAVGWVVKKSNSGQLPAIGNITPFETKSPLDDAANKKTKLKLQAVRAGGVHYLESDEDIEFADIADIGANFVKLLESQLHVIATSCFSTYSEMTGDLSQVNFSSIRAGLIASRRILEQHQKVLIIAQILNPIIQKFKVRAGLKLGTVITENPTITPPSWVWVDRKGEALSDLLELQSGVATLEEKLAEKGLTVRKYLESRKRSEEAEQEAAKSPFFKNSNKESEDSVDKDKKES